MVEAPSASFICEVPLLASIAALLALIVSFQCLRFARIASIVRTPFMFSLPWSRCTLRVLCVGKVGLSEVENSLLCSTVAGDTTSFWCSIFPVKLLETLNFVLCSSAASNAAPTAELTADVFGVVAGRIFKSAVRGTHLVACRDIEDVPVVPSFGVAGADDHFDEEVVSESMSRMTPAMTASGSRTCTVSACSLDCTGEGDVDFS